MVQYICPKCNKVNWIDSSISLTTISKCVFCGYEGSFSIAILKGDIEADNDLID